MKDDQIVDLYWARSEKAISETANKYGHYCYSIAYNILHSNEDSEECVNDTYLNTWNAMPDQRPSKLPAFLGRITRNLSLKRWEKDTAEKRGTGHVPLVLDELQEYAPASCRGVYVIRDGSKYLGALFCNILSLDDNTSTGMETLYGFYGIESSDDIASITEVDWNRDKAVENAVTGKSEITAFYELSSSLTSCGNDDFQKIVFESIPEDQQVKAHAEFANDLRVIRIETKDGLRFYIEFYPSFGWIYGNGTLSDYQIDARMADWIAGNLDR